MVEKNHGRVAGRSGFSAHGCGVGRSGHRDHGNCMGRQCPTYAKCFYYQARRRMQHAQILVVNHALFFSDLALRMQNASILPPYDVVIFDEAHNLEGVAGDHLGLSVTNGQVDYILRKLYNDRTNKGLLVYQHFGEAQQAVTECRHRADGFFQSIDDWIAEHPKGNGRVREPKIVGNPLSEGLEKLAGLLQRKAKELKKPEEKQDYSSAATRLGGLAAEIEDWRTHGVPDAVYWVESSKGEVSQTDHAGGRADRRGADPAGTSVSKSAHGDYDQRDVVGCGKVRFFSIADWAGDGQSVKRSLAWAARSIIKSRRN